MSPSGGARGPFGGAFGRLAPASRPPEPTGTWYLVLTAGSAGLLAWVPLIHAARVLGRKGLRRAVAGYAAATAVVLGLVAVALTVPGVPVVGPALAAGACALVTAGSATARLVPLQRAVYPPARPVLAIRMPRKTARALGAELDGRGRRKAARALADVVDDRVQRQTARALAEQDPELARELHIGRPDQRERRGPGYRDGGLVDCNTAPAALIARVCGIDRADADRIVAARDRLGGPFAGVDELLVLADLPTPAWPAVHTHAVLIPPP